MTKRNNVMYILLFYRSLFLSHVPSLFSTFIGSRSFTFSFLFFISCTLTLGSLYIKYPSLAFFHVLLVSLLVNYVQDPRGR